MTRERWLLYVGVAAINLAYLGFVAFVATRFGLQFDAAIPGPYRLTADPPTQLVVFAGMSLFLLDLAVAHSG